MMFYVWCECEMSVLGTTKHSSAIVLTLGNKVVLLYCVQVERLEQGKPGRYRVTAQTTDGKEVVGEYNTVSAPLSLAL